VYRRNRDAYCRNYIKRELALYDENGSPSCSAWVGAIHGYSTPWWKEPDVLDRLPTALSAGSESVSVTPRGDDAELFVQGFKLVVLPGILVGICMLPYFGTVVLSHVIQIVGPLFGGIFLVGMVQYRVYGPVTGNDAGVTQWDEAVWAIFSRVCLGATVLLCPFYSVLRSSFHQYYRRCLQTNYFCDGKDRPFTDLKDSPYCPFVILTGTSSDFQPPGDKDTISELSFSSLHCGSEETGYLQMPGYRSLAKCTALSGAGCLDAMSLTMSTALYMRFWLEFLNLSWGDYIIFKPRQYTYSNTGFVNRFVEFLPSSLLTFVTYAVLFVGLEAAQRRECEVCHWQYWVALLLQIAQLALSFFSFVPIFATLLMSPLLRQFHQATSYFYVGKHPPPMLYVTDGGVKDCTSLVQLLWRRRERILLVLAAADKDDDLKVLLDGMEVAKDLKIASFYDPEDPRRDLSVLFQKFKADRSIGYMHIGIRYSWDQPGAKPASGHLVIVKNRLPPEHEGAQLCQPLLTEAEMRGEQTCERDPAFDEEWEGVTTDSLGPWCCCDCAHTNGMNCGEKFPHGTFTGYLYLSPMWCNSLVRLAHEVSGPAIDKVSRARGLPHAWEDRLGT